MLGRIAFVFLVVIFASRVSWGQISPPNGNRGPIFGGGGLLAPPPNLLDNAAKEPSATPPARNANDTATPVQPVVPPSTAPDSDRPVTRVSKGTGVLPNDHGQVWREYDISPYTSKVTSTQKPEQALIDWILRETGTEVWFSEPLGILNADKNTLRVYHTPDMQRLIAGVVDRFVASKAETQVLTLRLVTVGNPGWRTKALPILKAVEVQSPGIDAWLTSRENAAYLIGELSKRSDYREHNSPNLVMSNGQSQTIARLRPKSYVRAVRPRDSVLPGFDTEAGTIEEGYSLQISPLFALDGKSADAVIKCHIDQVERLVPVTVDLPPFGGQAQRATIQVPQLVSWRLHERFRWPTDQVLLLSCGIVATPGPDPRGAAALVSALTTNPSRADALLFIECQGKATSPVAAEVPAAAARPGSYRGRY